MFEGFQLTTIETGQAAIRVRHGGGGPPVLLLHGFPQTHVMWHKIAPRLAREFTVVAADLRGYGGSSRPLTTADHEPYSKRAMARDMVALMQRLGFDRFSVVGHDRGGRVAYRLALDHPKRAERLGVLVSLHCPLTAENPPPDRCRRPPQDEAHSHPGGHCARRGGGYRGRGPRPARAVDCRGHPGRLGDGTDAHQSSAGGPGQGDPDPPLPLGTPRMPSSSASARPPWRARVLEGQVPAAWPIPKFSTDCRGRRPGDSVSHGVQSGPRRRRR
jgi:pimeloyl-ACP methyl ester carboxylesterase